MSMTRRVLKRSESDAWLGGVCGGIAEYVGWPSGRVRVLYVLASVLSAAFPGILAYVVLWVAMPPADHVAPE